MPHKLCIAPRCPNPATYRGRCQGHARSRERQTVSANKSLYNSKRWQITRRRKLFETPLCETEGCNAIATDVHHKVDIQQGGAVFSMSNLQALCHSCHSRITRRRQEGEGQP